MPDYRKMARNAASRHGLDPHVFERQIGAESGFNPNALSPKGATGIAQFMPDTARGLGIDPHNPAQALDGAAKLMASQVRQYGSYENALRAYNAGPAAIERSHSFPETNAYVAKILQGSEPKTTSVRTTAPRSRRSPSGAPRSAPAAPTSRTVANPAYAAQVKQSQNAGLLAKMFRSQGRGGALLSVLDDRAQAPDPATAFKTVTQAARRTPSSLGSVPAPARAAPGVVALGGGPARNGQVTVFNANPGRLHKPVVAFVNRVSAIYGKPLRADSGANHDKLTVDGNVSDHWAGNATDIPSSGHELLRLGRAALIAAGMPRAEALKQNGGLYNVNGHQVIFATNQGGNHFDHLHVSAK